MSNATKLSLLAAASVFVIASAAQARPHFRTWDTWPLGAATISENNGHLIVSNIGSSGEDGVGLAPESQYIQAEFGIPEPETVDALDYALWRENFGQTTAMQFDRQPGGSMIILFGGVGDPVKQVNYFDGAVLVAQDLINDAGDPDRPVLVGRASSAGEWSGSHEMKWDNTKQKKWSTSAEFIEPIEFLPAGATASIFIDRIEIVQDNTPTVDGFPEVWVHLSCSDAANPADVEFLILDGATSPCPTDFNGDGVTDGADLATLLSVWGQNSPLADLNGDGVVDGADLAALLAAWGSCTAP